MESSPQAMGVSVPTTYDAAEVKTCCAAAYSSDWAKLLLGDSFHPGGLALTERIGTLIGLGPDDRVLDIASGKGTSALFLARRFGCRVIGIDYSSELVRAAGETAVQECLSGLVRFEEGDAERLPFESGSFSVLVCECAFCTFPSKPAAASEFARVLRRGGRLGLSDLTRTGEVPPELQDLLSWVACIADAQPVDNYKGYLEAADLKVTAVEQHDDALQKMVRDIRGKLLGAELLVKLNKLSLPGAGLAEAQTLARAASEAIAEGRFGYAILTAAKGD